jgi:hypothetical protein
MPPPPRTTGPAGSWEAHGGAGFTFNGITAYGDGHDSRIGGDELSDTENVSGREWGSGVIEGKQRY